MYLSYSFTVKIGLFYVIYYAFLAGFFVAMLIIFYQTLDDKMPKWQNSNGIIGTNPGNIWNDTIFELYVNVWFALSGVGYRPQPASGSIESTLVHFRHGELGNWKDWSERLTEFLKRKEPFCNLQCVTADEIWLESTVLELLIVLTQDENNWIVKTMRISRQFMVILAQNKPFGTV